MSLNPLQQILKYLHGWNILNPAADSQSITAVKEIVIYEKSNDYQSAYDTALEYNKRYPEDEKGQKELKFLETRI